MIRVNGVSFEEYLHQTGISPRQNHKPRQKRPKAPAELIRKNLTMYPVLDWTTTGELKERFKVEGREVRRVLNQLAKAGRLEKKEGFLPGTTVRTWYWRTKE